MTATELLDEPLPADWTVEPGDASSREQGGPPPSQGLLLDLDRLSGSVMRSELPRCSAETLLQIHDSLGSMMKQVVLELQSRLHPDSSTGSA